MHIVVSDDSKSSREVIKYLISKQISAKISEAANGAEALNIVRTSHVDILITDIKMPIMDGLELMKETRSISKDIQFIVFSAFSNFEYAKKAMQYGAQNYLLKPINANEFQAVFEHVLSEADKIEIRKEQDIFKGIISNNAVILPIKNYNTMTLVCIYRNAFKYYDKIKEDLKGFGIQFIAYSENNDRIIIMSEIADSAMLKAFENVLTSSISGTEGMIFETEISENPSKAYNLLVKKSEEYYFWKSKGGIYRIDAGQTAQEQSIASFLSNASKMSMLLMHNPDKFDEQIAVITESIRNKKLSSKQCKYIFEEIAKCALMSMNAPVSPDVFDLLKLAPTIDDLKNELEALLYNENSFSDADLSDKNLSKPIKNALKIISNEYMLDISRDTVAQSVYMSSAYFSHRFKQETGVGFIQYLNDYRLKKACELLKNTDYSISEIGVKVGFSNYPYFCQQFKKKYGKTCAQFRNNTLRDDE